MLCACFLDFSLKWHSGFVCCLVSSVSLLLLDHYLVTSRLLLHISCHFILAVHAHLDIACFRSSSCIISACALLCALRLSVLIEDFLCLLLDVFVICKHRMYAYNRACGRVLQQKQVRPLEH